MNHAPGDRDCRPLLYEPEMLYLGPDWLSGKVRTLDPCGTRRDGAECGEKEARMQSIGEKIWRYIARMKRGVCRSARGVRNGAIIGSYGFRMRRGTAAPARVARYSMIRNRPISSSFNACGRCSPGPSHAPPESRSASRTSAAAPLLKRAGSVSPSWGTVFPGVDDSTPRVGAAPDGCESELTFRGESGRGRN